MSDAHNAASGDLLLLDEPLAAGDGDAHADSGVRGSERQLDLEANRVLECGFLEEDATSPTMRSDCGAAAEASAVLGTDDDMVLDALRMDDGTLLSFLDEYVSMDTLDLGFGGIEESRAIDDQDNCRRLVAVGDDAIPLTLTGDKPLHVGVISATIPTTTDVKSSKKRNRVKEEVAYLREQVAELEDKLRRLDKGTTGDKKLSSNHPSKLWKRIADHQMQQKQKSEVENAKLRELLEGQLKIARSLSKAFRKCPDLSWVDSSPHSSSQAKLPQVGSVQDSETVFELLEQQLDALYTQVDAVFAEAGCIDLKREIREGHVKDDAHGRVFLEMVDCYIVPFDLHATSAGMWTFVNLPSMKMPDGIYQAIDSTNDMLRAQFTVTLRLRRSEISLHMRLVGKRIIEADRVVIVWCTMGSSEGSLLGKENFRVRESGWMMVQEIPQSSDGDAENQHSSAIQTIVRMTPELEESSRSSTVVGILTDLVLGSFHRNLTTAHQAIENIIIANTSERS